MHLVTTKNDQHVNFMNNVAAYSSLIHIPNDGNGNLLLEYKSQAAFIGDFNNIHPYPDGQIFP